MYSFEYPITKQAKKEKIMTIKNTLALTAIASSLLSFSVTTVQAKDGFYIGGSYLNSTLGHTIERNTGSDTDPSLTSTSNDTDLGFGLNLGYKTHLSGDFYFAGELFYNQENAETRNINNLLITDVTLNSSYGLKLKSGVDVTDKFSVYSVVGLTSQS